MANIPVISSTCPPGVWPNDCCFCLRPSVHAHPKNTKLIKFEEFIAFETKLFKGEILFRLPNERTAAYFKGKQRKESIIIRGQFKKRLSMAQVTTGQEFLRDLKVPMGWMVKLGLKVFKFFSPTLEAEIEDNHAKFYNLLVRVSQVMRVKRESCFKEKISLGAELKEDCVLFQQLFSDFNPKMDRFERKKWFGNKKKEQLKNKFFEPGLYYSFEFFQHLFDNITYKINLGFSADVCKILNGQPLRIMAKDSESGDYLWDFEMWHDKQRNKNVKETLEDDEMSSGEEKEPSLSENTATNKANAFVKQGGNPKNRGKQTGSGWFSGFW